MASLMIKNIKQYNEGVIIGLMITCAFDTETGELVVNLDDTTGQLQLSCFITDQKWMEQIKRIQKPTYVRCYYELIRSKYTIHLIEPLKDFNTIMAHIMDYIGEQDDKMLQQEFNTQFAIECARIIEILTFRPDSDFQFILQQSTMSEQVIKQALQELLGSRTIQMNEHNLYSLHMQTEIDILRMQLQSQEREHRNKIEQLDRRNKQLVLDLEETRKSQTTRFEAVYDQMKQMKASQDRVPTVTYQSQVHVVNHSHNSKTPSKDLSQELNHAQRQVENFQLLLSTKELELKAMDDRLRKLRQEHEIELNEQKDHYESIMQGKLDMQSQSLRSEFARQLQDHSLNKFQDMYRITQNENSLRDQLNTKEEIIRKLQIDLRRFQDAQYDLQIQELQDRNDKLQQDLESAAQELEFNSNQNQEQIQKLNQQAYQKAYNQGQLEAIEIQQAYDQLNSQYNSLKDQQRRLESQNQSINLVLLEYQKDIEQWKANLSEVQNKHKQALNDQKNQYDDHFKKELKQQLTQQKAIYEQEKIQLSLLVKDLEKQITLQTNHIETIEYELNQLRKQDYNSLQMDFEQNQRQTQMISSDNERLKQRIQQLENKLHEERINHEKSVQQIQNQLIQQANGFQNERQSIENQLITLQQASLQSESTIRSLNLKIQNSTNDNQSQLNALNEKIKQLESEKVQLQEQLSLVSMQRYNLENQLNSLKAQQGQIQQQSMQLQEQLESHKNEANAQLESLQYDNQTLYDQHQEKDEELNKRQQAIEQLQHELLEKEEELSSQGKLKTELQTTQNKLKELKKSLDEQSSHIYQQNLLIEGQKEKIEENEQIQQQFNNQINQLKKNILVTNEQCQQMAEQIQNQDEQIDHDQSVIRQLKDEYQQLEDYMNEQIRNYTTQIEEFSTQNNELAQYRIRFEAERQSLESEIMQLKITQSENQSKIHSLTSQIKLTEQQQLDRQKEIEQLRIYLEKQQSELDQLEETNSAYQKLTVDFQQLQLKLSSEKKSNDRALQRLQDDIDSKEEQVQENINQATKLKANNDSYIKQISTLKKQVQQFQQQVQDLQIQQQIHEEQKLKIERDNQDLQQQVKSLSQQNTLYDQQVMQMRAQLKDKIGEFDQMKSVQDTKSMLSRVSTTITQSKYM